MAKRYLINIFLLIAVLCGFSSCEEDPYYDPYEEITYDLCNYVWTDWFVVEVQIVSSNLHLIRMGKDGIQEFIITQADAQIERKFHSTGTGTITIPIYLIWTMKTAKQHQRTYGLVVGTFKCLYNGEWVTFKAYQIGL